MPAGWHHAESEYASCHQQSQGQCLEMKAAASSLGMRHVLLWCLQRVHALAWEGVVELFVARLATACTVPVFQPKVEILKDSFCGRAKEVASLIQISRYLNGFHPPVQITGLPAVTQHELFMPISAGNRTLFMVVPSKGMCSFATAAAGGAMRA
jgi:hypothetical protein